MLSSLMARDSLLRLQPFLPEQLREHSHDAVIRKHQIMLVHEAAARLEGRKLAAQLLDADDARHALDALLHQQVLHRALRVGHEQENGRVRDVRDVRDGTKGESAWEESDRSQR